MDKPRSVNKNANPGFLSMGMLGLDIVLIVQAVTTGVTFVWILVVLIVAVAIVLNYICISKVLLDEDGIHFISHVSTVKYSWIELQQIGIETQWLKYGREIGVIVLWVKGRKSGCPIPEIT